MVNLRHCYILQKRESNLKSSEFETTFFGPSNQIMQTKSLILKFILQKILSWILVSGGSTQKMRVNLYGALLNYLNIVNLKTSAAEPEEDDDDDDSYISRLDSSKVKPSREDSSLKSMVIDVISGFGDNLCSVVCNDCVGGGHDVCRMVALSCLETLIEIDPRTDWMNTLTNQGYLRNLIDSLLQDDDGLKEALEPNPKSLRVLYVYESKMALLMKIAGTRVGAETVLAAGALGCLAGLRALHRHPDIHSQPAPADAQFVPPSATRFRQILVPALALCDALLTALGTDNHSCVVHVTHFLLGHLDCVETVLRAAHPESSEGLLAEAEGVTSVVCRVASAGWARAPPGTSLSGAAPQLTRLRALMLSALARFQRPPRDAAHSPCHLYCKIVCNLLTFARNVLEGEGGRAVLGPECAGAGEGQGEADLPQVGALLRLLQELVPAVHLRHKLVATAQHQLHNVPAMTLDDLKKLIPAESGEVTVQSAGLARAAAAGVLRARLKVRRRELQYCLLAVPAALHLVWAHLRLYLRLTAVVPQPDKPHKALTAGETWRGAGGAALPELRAALVDLFTDRFADQLLDTAKDQPDSYRTFLDLLLKDIKTMVQFSTV